jgi:hypothetical protein
VGRFAPADCSSRRSLDYSAPGVTLIAALDRNFLRPPTTVVKLIIERAVVRDHRPIAPGVQGAAAPPLRRGRRRFPNASLSPRSFSTPAVAVGTASRNGITAVYRKRHASDVR